MKKTKLGIIICDRYKGCAGGKCFRSFQKREGAFDIYAQDEDIELVGYTTCGGSPGGNIECSRRNEKEWCRSHSSGNWLFGGLPLVLISIISKNLFLKNTG